MAQGWVGGVATRVKHAFVKKPQTWPELIASLVVGSLLAIVVWDLLNRVEMLRRLEPPVLLIAAICGLQVHDFVRRRRRERAGSRQAAQEPQPPRAG